VLVVKICGRCGGGVRSSGVERKHLSSKPLISLLVKYLYFALLTGIYALLINRFRNCPLKTRKNLERRDLRDIPQFMIQSNTVTQKCRNFTTTFLKKQEGYMT